MKRLIALLLTILLLFPLLTACRDGNKAPATDVDGSSSKEDSSNEDTSKEEDSSKEDEVVEGGKLFDEPITLSFMLFSHASYPFQEDWYIIKAIEEKTNVKMDVIAVGEGLEERISLDMASGDLPDLTYIHSISDAQRYGADGAYVNVLDHIDKLPNFKKWKEAHEDSVIQYLAADGSLYEFPNYGIGETNRRGYMYRKDIFDKHGLEIPEDEEQFYNVLKKLKEEYPDSYPFTFRRQLPQFEMIAPSWGTNYGMYYDIDNGEWRYGHVEDNFKDMVEYFYKLYNEGLIPPDWLSLDTKGWQDIISTERAFVTLDYLVRIDGFNVMMKDTNPEFHLAYMPPYKGGENGIRKMAYSSIVPQGYAVASNSKKLEEALKFCDWLYTDEAMELVSWGEEGVTYTVENGERKFIDCEDVADIRKKYGISTHGTYLLFDYDAHMSTFSDELKAAVEEDRKYDLPELPTVAFTDEELEIVQSIGVNINTHAAETISKFLLGTKPLSEWDQYVKEIEELGLQQLIDVYTQAYERLVK